MLSCWGGTDDYQFEFEPEKNMQNCQSLLISTRDENDNTTFTSFSTKVCTYIQANTKFVSFDSHAYDMNFSREHNETASQL